METAREKAARGVKGGAKSRWKRLAETLQNWRTTASSLEWSMESRLKSLAALTSWKFFPEATRPRPRKLRRYMPSRMTGSRWTKTGIAGSMVSALATWALRAKGLGAAFGPSPAVGARRTQISRGMLPFGRSWPKVASSFASLRLAAGAAVAPGEWMSSWCIVDSRSLATIFFGRPLWPPRPPDVTDDDDDDEDEKPVEEEEPPLSAVLS
mmetsp:Transcript_15172/g.49363  ORF Transcript_15172/g.49363 Transcript_15172/m.49363 type:complete len:210 (-) Transcript_15172:596-1225(-)